MNIIKTAIPGVLILEPLVFGDDRGFFYETMSVKSLQGAGVDFQVAQENCAFSVKKGTIRGLHFQNDPAAQAKIVRCVKGSVIDFAVDLRKGSPTYLKYVSVSLTAENKKQLYLPKGFAHGVISTSDDCMIEYFADHPYIPAQDRSIRYNDPQIGVDWGVSNPILSEKDRNAPFLADSDCNFVWGNGQD